MTITQLQYVLAVAEYKNFTLAAEKSFVTRHPMRGLLNIARRSRHLKLRQWQFPNSERSERWGVTWGATTLPFLKRG